MNKILLFYVTGSAQKRNTAGHQVEAPKKSFLSLFFLQPV